MTTHLMKRFEANPTTLLANSSLFLLVLGALLTPLPVQAQTFHLDRVSIEPRVGVAFPTGDFGNVDPACPPGGSGCDYPMQIGTETGWRWEVRLHYALTSHWGVVGGFGKTKLDCSPSFCGPDDKPGTRALSLGVKGIAFPLGSMDIWVEGGGALEEISIVRTQDATGDAISTLVHYPWAPGFYGGIGAELPLTGRDNFFFTPGFRFRYVPADPPDAHSDLESVTATYVLFEVGFRVNLGKE